ncbi:MAG: oxidoreductase, partial [Actinomycetota bacterium]|nr:oxidoreductase [Actinomycetota bacterium]
MRAEWRTGLLAGVAAGAAGIGVGELVAAVLGSSPIGTSASAVIDLSPSWLKEFVIAVAGTADKVVLVVCLLLVGVAAAGAAGILEVRRAPWGAAPFVVLGTISILCAVTRSDAGLLAPLPSGLGTVAAIASLHLFIRLARREEAAPSAAERRVSRRGFLVATALSAVVGAAAAGGVQL